MGVSRLKVSQRLKLIIEGGEGYTVEFKEKCAHLDREIVAFANSAGGSIFLGIDDFAKIVGIEIDNRLQSQVMDIAHNCDPRIQVQLQVYREERVLEIMVAEGNDKPYRCRDGFFRRQGPNSQKLKRDEIAWLITQSPKMRFDETINMEFNYPNDFSKSAMQAFLKQANINSTLSYESILLNLNLAVMQQDQLKLKQAGVLFFAKEPQKFLVESYITAVSYRTEDKLNVVDKKDFYGSPISQIEEALLFIERHMNVGMSITANPSGAIGVRQDVYDYPLVALREAVINAVVHRDYYYDASHIYVHLYPNHVDIENPGGLYHGMTIEYLTKRSIRRNRLIADILHRAKYIERIGSGFSRIEHTLAENNNPPYQVTAANFFNIRFGKRVSNRLELELTTRQQHLLLCFKQSKQLTKIQAALLLSVSEDTALREIKSLVQLKLVTKKGTGKATVYVYE